MESGRGARGHTPSRNSGKKQPNASNRGTRYRPNPLRQLRFVGLAMIGIGIGWGAGYLFKGTALPESKPPTPAATQAATQAAAPAPVAAPPLLPEAAAPGNPVRPYEEALPRDIIENGASSTARGREITVTTREPAVGAAETPPPDPGLDAGPATAPATEPAAEVAARPPAPAEKAAAAAPSMTPSVTPGASPAAGDKPAWRRHAVQVALAADRPKIAIVVDDLGIDRPRTARTIRLPGPLTLSFLTYASGLAEQTRAARAAGHELLMHIPMEPGSADVDPGPNVLLTGIPEDELLASLRWNLTQFEGYVGVNNHMGSRFTADITGMVAVMKEMKRRELLFLDSVTAGKSVARKAADRVGVPFAVRNVFLDDKDDVHGISRRLAEVEALARKTGVAVAIGHPRESTLKALGPWLEGIESRGFQLVPVSAVIGLRASRG